MTNNANSINQQRYVILRSFLTAEEQTKLAQEALCCHLQHSKEQHNCNELSVQQAQEWKRLETSSSSLKLHLGIDCGGDLQTNLPMAVKYVRKAFQKAIDLTNHHRAKSELIPPIFASDSTPLTGLALLYGPNASMTAHYDSPTQPLQREEWLTMMTMGNPTVFRCNRELVTLYSGDVLVMDSMATLHGVEQILPSESHEDYSYLGLPVPESRLGILLWQGKTQEERTSVGGGIDAAVVEGVEHLFGADDDDDEESY